ncbi:unnamed protein product, partial [Rotaria sordida]
MAAKFIEKDSQKDDAANSMNDLAFGSTANKFETAEEDEEYWFNDDDEKKLDEMATWHAEMMALPEHLRVEWKTLEGGVETDISSLDESVNKSIQENKDPTKNSSVDDKAEDDSENKEQKSNNVFHSHDPASTNTNATIVLPELTRNYVFKHLLSIYPNLPVFGRNSIKIKSICPSTYFTPKDKHYLILKPISISSGTKWPNPIPDPVESHELHYISQMIFELTIEERQSST